MKFTCQQCKKLHDTSSGPESMMVQDFNILNRHDVEISLFTPLCMGCLTKMIPKLLDCQGNKPLTPDHG